MKHWFKKWLLFASLLIVGCSAEPLETTKPQGMTYEEVLEANKPKSYTFTVIWDSNQEDSYVELNKMNFKDCKLTILSTETHREKRFEVVLQNNQPFDIQILRGVTKKNPELYLAIYKGDELQYEQEVNTNGFLLSTWVDRDGNIKD